MSQRLFIAIELPPGLQAAAAALAAPAHDVRWTPEDALHLTLRFIGDTPDGEVPLVRTALARVEVEPFLLPLAGAGLFPPRGLPRVLWAGVGSGHTRLHQLRQQVDDALLQSGASVAEDPRPFVPHVTLARCGPGAENFARQFARRHRDWEGGLFRVDAITLFRSDLGPAGAVHTILLRHPLDRGHPA